MGQVYRLPTVFTTAVAPLTFAPETFRCAVAVSGPTSLLTLIQSVPRHWKSMVEVFQDRLGNPDDPKERELLRRASPLFAARTIKAPLLLAQGGKDQRAKAAETEQVVAAVEKNRGRAVYVVYPDEGHGLARLENRVDFYARAEAFLAEHLGGRAELLEGAKIKGATAVVKVVGKR